MTIQAQVKVEDLAKMVTWPKMVKTWKRLAMSNTVLCSESQVLHVIERHQPTCTRLDFDLFSPWPKSAKQVWSLKRRLHECGWVREHSMGWCIESFEMVKWTHLGDWQSCIYRGSRITCASKRYTLQSDPHQIWWQQRNWIQQAVSERSEAVQWWIATNAVELKHWIRLDSNFLTTLWKVWVLTWHAKQSSKLNSQHRKYNN